MEGNINSLIDEFEYKILTYSNISGTQLQGYQTEYLFDDELSFGDSDQLVTPSREIIIKDLLVLQKLIKIQFDFFYNCNIQEALQLLRRAYKFLPQLETVVIQFYNYQNISIEDSESLGYFINHLTFLSHFRIKFKNFYSDKKLKFGLSGYLRKLFVTKSQIKSLEIEIDSLQIKEEGIAQIVGMFKYLDDLQEFTLSISKENQIGNQGAIILGDSLTILSNLTYLSLKIGENSTKMEGIIAIFKGIRQLKNLQHLTIDVFQNTCLEEEVIIIAGQCFQELINLKVLAYYVNGKNISEKGAFLFGKSLASHSNIISLTLNIGNIQLQENFGQMIQTNIFQGLSNLENLSLEIAQDNIPKDGLSQIILNLSPLKKLTHFSCLIGQQQEYYNRSKAGIRINNLNQLQNLTYLSLNCVCNYIEDDSIHNLLQDISSLTCLSSLFLKLKLNIPQNVLVLQQIRLFKNLTKLTSFSLLIKQEYNINALQQQINLIKDILEEILTETVISMPYVSYLEYQKNPRFKIINLKKKLKRLVVQKSHPYYKF